MRVRPGAPEIGKRWSDLIWEPHDLLALAILAVFLWEMLP